MTITTEINEAKSDLDVLNGELERLSLLLGPILEHIAILPTLVESIDDALDIAISKGKRVRAAL